MRVMSFGTKYPVYEAGPHCNNLSTHPPAFNWTILRPMIVELCEHKSKKLSVTGLEKKTVDSHSYIARLNELN